MTGSTYGVFLDSAAVLLCSTFQSEQTIDARNQLFTALKCAYMTPMIDTPLVTISPGPSMIPADISTSLDHGGEHSSLYINMLPVAPESECFGDNLCCAVINSCGSGDSFSKIEVVADFAEDELLDIIFVTELKTTLAKVMAAKVHHRGFLSWWGARDVIQSNNDGVMVLVHTGWAKYVQKIEYWKG